MKKIDNFVLIFLIFYYKIVKFAQTNYELIFTNVSILRRKINYVKNGQLFSKNYYFIVK